MNPGTFPLFRTLTARLEGVVPYFYLDIKGLVTIGYGCLVEPSHSAATLTLFRADGKLATSKEVVQDWRTVKLCKRLASQGHLAAASVAKLRMKPEHIERLMEDRLQNMESDLAPHFWQWEGTGREMPVQAQTAILLIAWAIGSAVPRKFPKFTAAINREDWQTAAKECKIAGEDTNRGLIARNLAIRALLLGIGKPCI